MSFTAEQNGLLAADLYRAHVKGRTQAGRTLSYLESWHVIAEANRIFGFDGWQSETVECRMVSERERGNGREGFNVSYVARVRVTVWAGKRRLVREGVGAGHGIDRDLGQAHESAIKEAESDARKRGLMTFGNPFGLALYDKSQANVSHDPQPKPQPSPERQERVAAALEADPHEQAARAMAMAVARGADPDLPADAEPEMVTTAEKTRPTPPAANSETEISRRTRMDMVDALSSVYTAKQLDGWKKAHSGKSGIWQQMTTPDREAVLNAVSLKETAVKPRGGVDVQRPLSAP